jgi:hypothetical protein
MHRLRKIAEQTGVAYEDLVTAGKSAAKYTKIKSQLSFMVSDPDIQEFITNTASFNKDGKAEIEFMVNGKPVKKLVSQITQMDLASLKTQSEEEKTLKELAMEARTFDEAFNNTVNLFKKSLLPFIETINAKLLPSLDSFTMQMKQGGWLDTIGNFASTIGTFVSTVGSLILNNPFAALATWAVFKAATWYAYGVQLGLGFNTVTGGGGGLASGLGNLAPVLGKLALRLGGLGVAIGGMGIATSLGNEQIKKGNEKTGAAINIGGSILAGAAGGAMIGSTIPVIGTAIGAGIGGLGGAAYGLYQSLETTKSMNDGVFGGDTNNRGIIQNGKITPIDNKDDLIAMKKGGAIDKFASKAESKPGIVKHVFSDLNINGSLMISIPGNQSMGVDLLKDPMFIRDISKMIKVEMQRSVNQIPKG